MSRRDPSARARANEDPAQRLRRTFSAATVRAAMEKLGYAYDAWFDTDEEAALYETNPRAWDYEALQGECRRITRTGVG